MLLYVGQDPYCPPMSSSPNWIINNKSINIGIKHGFSCINIHQVPREVLKTEAGGRGFQHLPRGLASVNAWKKPCSIAIIA